ncbi:MAG: glutathione S-transferase family protein [Kordiimonadaceae bacterium]|nr:glutathione S-transferase family protein [Kordiimonadaceae bacterium]
MSDNKLKLYTFPLSGHAHRAELALSLLGVDYEAITLDLAGGEQRSDWYKEINSAGVVPALVDGETFITESTAILTYLAAKFDDGTWLPKDAENAAHVAKWFARASAGLAAGPAAARLITVFGAGFDPEVTAEKAHTFLAFLEAELEGKDFLVAGRPTFADVAIYSYTAHAPEGYISLDNYTNIRRWIAAIEALPGFVGMSKTEVAAAA